MRNAGGYGFTIDLESDGGSSHAFNHRGYMEYQYSKDCNQSHTCICIFHMQSVN
ncbi:hypothetical protein Back11_13670 [Paenibacillus baekrokdamisoli]|uniref:Uncharacterized protein n=1 Tax=Paenibacillus baekrokdamisoli TaxID=1712516 RepID=A0A3G9IP35_9BACL|nr:hypothetical protein Back11_13670 [Paenibacillus baekrokdamisoli]